MPDTPDTMILGVTVVDMAKGVGFTTSISDLEKTDNKAWGQSPCLFMGFEKEKESGGKEEVTMASSPQS